MHAQLPANRLLELRETRQVSLMDIAAACRVYPSTVKRWESGVIPQHRLPTIAELLGVSVAYLAGWTDDPQDESAEAS